MDVDDEMYDSKVLDTLYKAEVNALSLWVTSDCRHWALFRVAMAEAEKSSSDTAEQAKYISTHLTDTLCRRPQDIAFPFAFDAQNIQWFLWTAVVSGATEVEHTSAYARLRRSISTYQNFTTDNGYVRELERGIRSATSLQKIDDIDRIMKYPEGHKIGHTIVGSNPKLRQSFITRHGSTKAGQFFKRVGDFESRLIVTHNSDTVAKGMHKPPGTAKFTESRMNGYWRAVHPRTRLKWLEHYRRLTATIERNEKEVLEGLPDIAPPVGEVAPWQQISVIKLLTASMNRGLPQRPGAWARSSDRCTVHDRTVRRGLGYLLLLELPGRHSLCQIGGQVSPVSATREASRRGWIIDLPLALNLLIMTTPACTVPSSGDKTITLPGDRKVNFATKRLPEPYLVALGSTRQKEVRDEPRLPSLLLSGQTIQNTLTPRRYLPPADHLTDIIQRQGSAYGATAQVADVPEINQFDGQGPPTQPDGSVSDAVLESWKPKRDPPLSERGRAQCEDVRFDQLEHFEAEGKLRPVLACLREQCEVNERSGRMRVSDLRDQAEPSETEIGSDTFPGSNRFLRLDGLDGAIDPFAAHDTVNETDAATEERSRDAMENLARLIQLKHQLGQLTREGKPTTGTDEAPLDVLLFTHWDYRRYLLKAITGLDKEKFRFSRGNLSAPFVDVTLTTKGPAPSDLWSATMTYTGHSQGDVILPKDVSR
ncbi:uncharacterized protein MKK02DRAFT_29266 [Dioszegia hungarica]|uniref:Uncharacterized protein n=1 Tax=Dioszegia hungarica TaxID=4972 RepID=A0AA38LWV9_9TREE|nr:uncharacterized protein MKK02DRAFT_29266 [Dioszegia hungarica]KAI9639147.1 hypothetical protein MKK02DRAFT_29266 [Dioszegia hungarica]